MGGARILARKTVALLLAALLGLQPLAGAEGEGGGEKPQPPEQKAPPPKTDAGSGTPGLDFKGLPPQNQIQALLKLQGAAGQLGKGGLNAELVRFLGSPGAKQALEQLGKQVAAMREPLSAEDAKKVELLKSLLDAHEQLSLLGVEPVYLPEDWAAALDPEQRKRPPTRDGQLRDILTEKRSKEISGNADLLALLLKDGATAEDGKLPPKLAGLFAPQPKMSLIPKADNPRPGVLLADFRRSAKAPPEPGFRWLPAGGAGLEADFPFSPRAALFRVPEFAPSQLGYYAQGKDLSEYLKNAPADWLKAHRAQLQSYLDKQPRAKQERAPFLIQRGRQENASERENALGRLYRLQIDRILAQRDARLAPLAALASGRKSDQAAFAAALPGLSTAELGDLYQRLAEPKPAAGRAPAPEDPQSPRGTARAAVWRAALDLAASRSWDAAKFGPASSWLGLTDEEFARRADALAAKGRNWGDLFLYVRGANSDADSALRIGPQERAPASLAFRQFAEQAHRLHAARVAPLLADAGFEHSVAMAPLVGLADRVQQAVNAGIKTDKDGAAIRAEIEALLGEKGMKERLEPRLTIALKQIEAAEAARNLGLDSPELRAQDAQLAALKAAIVSLRKDRAALREQFLEAAISDEVRTKRMNDVSTAMLNALLALADAGANASGERRYLWGTDIQAKMIPRLNEFWYGTVWNVVGADISERHTPKVAGQLQEVANKVIALNELAKDPKNYAEFMRRLREEKMIDEIGRVDGVIQRYAKSQGSLVGGYLEAVVFVQSLPLIVGSGGTAMAGREAVKQALLKKAGIEGVKFAGSVTAFAGLNVAKNELIRNSAAMDGMTYEHPSMRQAALSGGMMALMGPLGKANNWLIAKLAGDSRTLKALGLVVTRNPETQALIVTGANVQTRLALSMAQSLAATHEIGAVQRYLNAVIFEGQDARAAFNEIARGDALIHDTIMGTAFGLFHFGMAEGNQLLARRAAKADLRALGLDPAVKELGQADLVAALMKREQQLSAEWAATQARLRGQAGALAKAEKQFLERARELQAAALRVNGITAEQAGQKLKELQAGKGDPKDVEFWKDAHSVLAQGRPVGGENALTSWGAKLAATGKPVADWARRVDDIARGLLRPQAAPASGKVSSLAASLASAPPGSLISAKRMEALIQGQLVLQGVPREKLPKIEFVPAGTTENVFHYDYKTNTIQLAQDAMGRTHFGRATHEARHAFDKQSAKFTDAEFQAAAKASADVRQAMAQLERPGFMTPARAEAAALTAMNRYRGQPVEVQAEIARYLAETHRLASRLDKLERGMDKRYGGAENRPVWARNLLEKYDGILSRYRGILDELETARLANEFLKKMQPRAPPGAEGDGRLSSIDGRGTAGAGREAPGKTGPAAAQLPTVVFENGRIVFKRPNGSLTTEPGPEVLFPNPDGAPIRLSAAELRQVLADRGMLPDHTLSFGTLPKGTKFLLDTGAIMAGKLAEVVVGGAQTQGRGPVRVNLHELTAPELTQALVDAAKSGRPVTIISNPKNVSPEAHALIAQARANGLKIDLVEPPTTRPGQPPHTHWKAASTKEDNFIATGTASKDAPLQRLEFGMRLPETVAKKLHEYQRLLNDPESGLAARKELAAELAKDGFVLNDPDAGAMHLSHAFSSLLRAKKSLTLHVKELKDAAVTDQLITRAREGVQVEIFVRRANDIDPISRQRLIDARAETPHLPLTVKTYPAGAGKLPHLNAITDGETTYVGTAFPWSPQLSRHMSAGRSLEHGVILSKTDTIQFLQQLGKSLPKPIDWPPKE